MLVDSKYALYQTLRDHVSSQMMFHRNKHKKWEYGYDKEYDMVVISKDGTVGEIIEINHLKIALPLQPDYGIQNTEGRWIPL